MPIDSGIDWERMGERIHIARRRKGLTTEALAQRAGTARATISRLENARKPHISLDVIVRIADALEVSVDFLTGRAKEEESELLAAAVA
jgi:transcriptional regulator with XRE-family HTH domain